MNKKMKKTAVAGLACAVSLVFAGCSQGDEPVAKLKGVEISKEELTEKLLEENGTQVLDMLVTEKIVELELKKQKLSVTDKEVDEEIAELEEGNGGKEAFDQALATSGMTREALRKDLTFNAGLEKLLQKSADIKEEELQAYFKENEASFAKPEQVKASHILVEDEKTALEVKAKVDKGDDFADLAKEYSTESGADTSGGDLGYFGRGAMVAEFDAAVFALGVGEVSDVVKTEFGYHVIKLTDKKVAEAANYEKSKDDVKEAVLQEKMQEVYTAWIDTMYKQYNVEKLLNAKK